MVRRRQLNWTVGETDLRNRKLPSTPGRLEVANRTPGGEAGLSATARPARNPQTRTAEVYQDRFFELLGLDFFIFREPPMVA
jgi:hypothetical protein